MIPPSRACPDQIDSAPAHGAAVFSHVPPDGAPCGPPPAVLRKRADFLRAASARRQAMPGFLLQGRNRHDDQPCRMGYTCSKKLGNAVMRNRAKRRLRAVARAVLPELGRTGWDYVLVGRPRATIERDFSDLCADLRSALHRIHREGQGARRKPRKDKRK